MGVVVSGGNKKQMFKFVKLVVNQESDICNATHYRLSGVKEVSSFNFYFQCYTCKLAGEIVLAKAKCIYTINLT